jgi:hypothetical protein
MLIYILVVVISILVAILVFVVPRLISLIAQSGPSIPVPSPDVRSQNEVNQVHVAALSGLTESSSVTRCNRPPPESHGSIVPFVAGISAATRKIALATWQFKIDFLFMNCSKRQIVFDDVHVRILARDIPTPSYATIGYKGEIVLLQDNTLQKREGEYSVLPGDGLQFSLILQLSRVEGSNTYAASALVEGPLSTVFGLLVDYYVISDLQAVERATSASKCVYLFQAISGTDWTPLKPISLEDIPGLRKKHANSTEMLTFVNRLDDMINDHHNFDRDVCGESGV